MWQMRPQPHKTRTLAKDKCLRCQKMGHFAAVFRSKCANEVQKDDGVVVKGSGVDHWLLGLLSGDSLEDNKWRVQLKVSGKPLVFKIDTGADITAMSKSTFDSLPSQLKLHPSRIVLFSPGGELQCAGQFTTIMPCCNKNYEVDIFVISGDHASNLVGRQTACEIGRGGCGVVWGHRSVKL